MKKNIMLLLTLIASINYSVTAHAEDLSISKVTTITKDTTEFCKEYYPQMYMQDFEGIKMPNGEDVAEKGILLTELSIIDTEMGGEIVTPDIFIEKYP